MPISACEPPLSRKKRSHPYRLKGRNGSGAERCRRATGNPTSGPKDTLGTDEKQTAESLCPKKEGHLHASHEAQCGGNVEKRVRNAKGPEPRPKDALTIRVREQLYGTQHRERNHKEILHARKPGYFLSVRRRFLRVCIRSVLMVAEVPKKVQKRRKEVRRTSGMGAGVEGTISERLARVALASTGPEE